MEDRRATVTDALQSTTFRLYSAAPLCLLDQSGSASELLYTSRDSTKMETESDWQVDEIHYYSQYMCTKCQHSVRSSFRLLSRSALTRARPQPSIAPMSSQDSEVRTVVSSSICKQLESG